LRYRITTPKPARAWFTANEFFLVEQKALPKKNQDAVVAGDFFSCAQAAKSLAR
jgi:hypothetical protein